MHALARIIGTATLALLPLAAEAAPAPSFTDVPSTHEAFPAIEYLLGEGRITGFPDGSFHPDQPINRAESIKLLLSGTEADTAISTSGSLVLHKDVPVEAWFAPYVSYAAERGLIDGPTKAAFFRPTQTVTRAEFLKLLLMQHDINAQTSYGEFRYPIALDVRDADAWYYPYLRYALTASLVLPAHGSLLPGEPLTRSAAADILYRYLLYTQKQQTQTLLSSAENEVLLTFRMIDTGGVQEAEESAARAVLAARGALTAEPGESIVKATVKVSEAALLLAQASRPTTADTRSAAIDAASSAWHLAERGKEFSSGVSALATEIQKRAAALADVNRKAY